MPWVLSGEGVVESACGCQGELMGEVYAPMSADQAANLPPPVAFYLRISFPLFSREGLPP